MNKYNYVEAVKHDIEQFLNDNPSLLQDEEKALDIVSFVDAVVGSPDDGDINKYHKAEKCLCYNTH